MNQYELVARAIISTSSDAIIAAERSGKIMDENGQVAGLAAVLRDVTKRFEELRALKRKLDHLQAASEQPLGVAL
jgi:hypothetical protein